MAFAYATKKGLMLESTYPYIGNLSGACYYDASKVVVKPRAFAAVERKNPTALLKAIKAGPVSVILQADSDVFQHYKAGIINSDECGTTSLEHAATILGYGTSFKGTPYYIDPSKL